MGPLQKPRTLKSHFIACSRLHREFGGTFQRADIVLQSGPKETLIEIDAPRNTELKPGDIIGLEPRRYRLFPA